MNLSAYDAINEKVNKQKSWINIKKKTLLSREITHRAYTVLIKRYDTETNTSSYYVAVTNTAPTDRQYKPLKVDDYGRVKISLTSIWNETYLGQLDRDCNILVTCVECGNDGDIYLLDI